MEDELDDYEPSEEELKEIEEILKYDTEDFTPLKNRIFWEYDDFKAFIRWLKKHGIVWK